MAITYTKIGFNLIADKLRDLLNDEFKGVYISDAKKEMTSSESWKIKLLSSTNEITHRKFETREYAVNLRYYMEHQNAEKRTEHVLNNVDRMKKHLVDNIAVNNYWAEVLVDTVEYSVQDEENEEKPDLSITDLNLLITATVAYS